MKAKHLLLTLACLLGMGITPVKAQTSGITGDVEWKYSDNTLTIFGTGEMGNYNMSDNNAPWRAAYSNAIKTVIIEDGVTSIGDFAFYGCTSLASVTIPGSVTLIRYAAFSDCSSLKEITIPESVESIGSSAFYNCTGLTSVDIPESVESIGDFAFYNCTGLTSVDIPGSVESIGEYAFYYCTGLTSVDIPGSVESIGYAAFADCTDLASVTIQEGVTSIGNNAFYGCSSLASVDIPGSVESIGEYAFYYCTGLTSVTIQGSVTSIGERAFAGCTSLEGITVLAQEPPALGDYVFYNVPVTSTILYVPAGSVEAYKEADGWKDFLNILPLTEPDPTWHTITLEVAPGIDLHQLAAGEHPIAEGDYLHLQFLTEDRSLTADDVLFLIDGVETGFKVFGGNNYYSYILNPVTQDHSILIALRQYPVTLPEVEGITFNPGSGTHPAAYGEKFTFTLTLDETIDELSVHVYANGREILPDALRAIALDYTIDQVTGPVTITVTAEKSTVGNMNAASGISVAIDNGQLTIDNLTGKPVDAMVYSVQGKQIATRRVDSSATISLQPGIYFVKAGNKVYKVCIY